MFGFLRWSFCLNSQNPGDRETGSSNVLNRYELFRYAPAPSVKGKTVQTAYCEGWSALCMHAVSKSALVDVWQIVGKWRLAAGRLSSLLHSPCNENAKDRSWPIFFKNKSSFSCISVFFQLRIPLLNVHEFNVCTFWLSSFLFWATRAVPKAKARINRKNFMCSSDFPFILNVSSKTSCCIW